MTNPQTPSAMDNIRNRWDTWLVLAFSILLLLTPFLAGWTRQPADDGQQDERYSRSLLMLTEYGWMAKGQVTEYKETFGSVNASLERQLEEMQRRSYSEDIGLDSTLLTGELTLQHVPLTDAGQGNTLTANFVYSGTMMVGGWLECGAQTSSIRDSALRMPEDFSVKNLHISHIQRYELYGPGATGEPYGALMRIADKTYALYLQRWLEEAKRVEGIAEEGPTSRLRCMYRNGAVVEFRLCAVEGGTLVTVPILGNAQWLADGALAESLEKGWDATIATVQKARKLIEGQDLRVKDSGYYMQPYSVRGQTELQDLQGLAKRSLISSELKMTEYLQLRWELQAVALKDSDKAQETITACFLISGGELVCAWLEAPWANTPLAAVRGDRVPITDRTWMRIP